MRTQPNDASRTQNRGDATRDALLATATRVFARNGYHAVSTRDIAEAARVNQALIGYHFRNKEGLYLAVFAQITAQMRAMIGPVVDVMEQQLAEAGDRSARQSARFLSLLLTLTDNMAQLLSQKESEEWGLLIVREQQVPTAAFSVLYEGFMKRVMTLLTELVLRIRGSNDRKAAQLIVVTILGQVIVFRAARAGVLRHMGWKQIGAEELAQVQRRIRANVTAIVSAKE